MSARAKNRRPVCVLGLGLIGGSLLRACAAADREAFGYNRSIDGVLAARADGFDAGDGITEVLAYGTAVWVEPA